MSTAETSPTVLEPLPPPSFTEVYGKPAVTIPARHKSHVLKSGEVVYQDATETYQWQRQKDSEYIDLTKLDGTSYTVGPWSCTCPAFEFSKPVKICKHIEGLWYLKMFGGAWVAAGGA